MWRQRLIFGFTYNRLFIFIGRIREPVNCELTFDVTKSGVVSVSFQRQKLFCFYFSFEFLSISKSKNKKFMFKIGIWQIVWTYLRLQNKLKKSSKFISKLRFLRELSATGKIIIVCKRVTEPYLIILLFHQVVLSNDNQVFYGETLPMYLILKTKQKNLPTATKAHRKCLIFIVQCSIMGPCCLIRIEREHIACQTRNATPYLPFFLSRIHQIWTRARPSVYESVIPHMPLSTCVETEHRNADLWHISERAELPIVCLHQWEAACHLAESDVSWGVRFEARRHVYGRLISATGCCKHKHTHTHAAVALAPWKNCQGFWLLWQAEYDTACVVVRRTITTYHIEGCTGAH